MSSYYCIKCDGEPMMHQSTTEREDATLEVHRCNKCEQEVLVEAMKHKPTPFA